jgi:RNA polymerase sigma-70 factor, ECF subfamily
MIKTTSGQGRRRRFDRIVATFHQDMYRYALWLSRDRTVAEDVVQEAMLRAWRSLDALREDGAAKSWLLTIVRRENARYFERRRPAALDVDDLTPAQAAELAEQPDEQVDALRAAIFELDDGYREPLVLQVLMGYSTQEIADHMGIRQGAVLTRLHRARLKLKETLDGAEEPQ